MIVNQSNEFPAPPQATASFQQVSQRKCPNPYPRVNLEEETEVHQGQVYEVSQDRVICLPLCSPVLPHFPKVPIRIVGQVTFNTQR